MKLAIISDTHFGDKTCQLVTKNEDGSYAKGPRFDKFANAVGNGNSFLVLAGDIFDFSISDYTTAYEYGKKFFELVQEAELAEEMIYLSGNHDFDVWHTMQHQRSIINRIIKREKPQKEFQHSVAGIIDDRPGMSDDQKGLTLDRTTRKSGKKRYCGMFLDYLTDPPTYFNFAYPNLYIVTEQGTVMVTHGQYFEPYWSILGEIAVKIAGDDLELKPGEVDIERTVEMNFPFNQLACTGVGQAGLLTERVMEPLEKDIKEHKLDRVTKYLDKLEKVVDDMTEYGLVVEWLADYAASKGKQKLLKILGSIETTRGNERYLTNDFKMRIESFYKSSLLEIKGINARTGQNIPMPDTMIFGHSHLPVPWNHRGVVRDVVKLNLNEGKQLTLNNTGGWLGEKEIFCGANIFLYETDKSFISVPVY